MIFQTNDLLVLVLTCFEIAGRGAHGKRATYRSNEPYEFVSVKELFQVEYSSTAMLLQNKD